MKPSCLFDEGLDGEPAYAQLRRSAIAPLVAVFRHQLPMLVGRAVNLALAPDAGRLLSAVSISHPMDGNPLSLRMWDIWRATVGTPLAAGAGGDGRYAAVVTQSKNHSLRPLQPRAIV